jgi:hypothetical protein
MVWRWAEGTKVTFDHQAVRETVAFVERHGYALLF